MLIPQILNVFKNKYFAVTVLILIIIAFTLFIRLQSSQLTVTDSWAKNSVYNFYRQNIAIQINSQYPNLPQDSKNALVDKAFADLLKNENDRIDSEIIEVSSSFRSRLQYNIDGETQTYLGDLDSYYYLRQARNYLMKGYTCDEINSEGKCFDSYIVAPIGGGAQKNLHPYAIGVFYKIISLFTTDKDQDILLIRAAFLLPVILAALTAIFAFLLARKIAGNLGGFFASIFVTVSPIFISRTAGSDTDIWNLFFPVLIAWLFIEAYSADKIKNKIIFIVLSAIATGIFSFAWVGWWYIFDFLLLAQIAYIVYVIIAHFVKKQKIKGLWKESNLRNSVLFLFLFFILSELFVAIISGWDKITAFFIGPTGVSVLKDAAHSTLWPNIFTTVAELNEANLPTIVTQAGGSTIFFLALLGGVFWLIKRFEFDLKHSIFFIASVVIFLIVLRNIGSLHPYFFFLLIIIPIVVSVFIYGKELNDAELKFSFLLAIWLIGTTFASLKGVRFILLLSPIIGISAGVALYWIFEKIKELLVKFFSIGKKIWVKAVSLSLFVIVFFVILLTPITSGYNTAVSYVPSINDGWVDSLQKIKSESKPDAIINSWWDFGHWFKYWADRRVTLDGITQNSPQAQWLGRMIQTPNEDETIGIMRMLDCGSNNAFMEVNKKYQDTEFSVALIKKIILQDKTGAAKTLVGEGFSEDEAIKILKLTHCDPPENYFITSGDMVGKASVWGHFGFWNFSKAWMATNLRSRTLSDARDAFFERYATRYTEDEFNSIYFQLKSLSNENQVNAWISPWPSYIGYSNNCAKDFDNTTEMSVIFCDYNVGLANDGNQRIVLDAAAIYPGALNSSFAKIDVFDARTGIKLGENSISFSRVVYGLSDSNQLDYYDFGMQGLSFGIFVSEYPNGGIRSVIADPLLLESTFTKLFYLDGAHTEHFEKFSDLTDIYGTRIIVWKVNWSP